MNKVNWSAIVIIGLIALLILLVGASLLGARGFGGWGRWGTGMMGPGMMGGWGFGMFGWLAMFFIWLIPVGLVVLIGLGIAWLVRAINAPGGSYPPERSCPNCGRSVQPDWRNCPYCGQELA
jgi:hypothetical protein